ncbi:hypothetical protein ABID21_003511 [Pseudorhizobium tarimense]|uniref:Uncharacterized protein n=1 Tax=Pseudorhizobium tarimense TaxID=1079109 RepID=A0ABV2HA35_9HYPH|nr:hypothetical protein [Pseudorhizobium tarimense]MCJ8520605.1 hypothetical protein [Pseudorhizobium tarimense]
MNLERYPHQRQLVVEIEGYAFVVPCVEGGRRSLPEDILSQPKGNQGRSKEMSGNRAIEEMVDAEHVRAAEADD